MGARIVTFRDWILFSVIACGISTCVALVYHVLSVSLATILNPLIFATTLCSFSTLVLFFLIFLRFRIARYSWLKLWVYVSPLFLSSIFILSSSPFFVLLVWLAVILLSLWGYYGRFKIMPDSRLHKARFARRDELADLLSSKIDHASLLIGETLLRKFYLFRTTQIRPELGNILIVAPTRGGKGLLAVSQLLSWKHSVIVNDIKGDLFDQTAGYRATLGKVYVISPLGYGHRYDPLKNKTTESQLYEVATRLLFKPNERDPTFTKRAIKMLQVLFLAARLEGQSPLSYVRQVTRLGLPEAAERINRLSPDLARQFLSRSFDQADFTNRFLLSSWEGLLADLEPFLTETVVKSFSGSDFTIEEIMCSQEPVTIYLRWSERDILSHAHAPLVRLIWEGLIDELKVTYDGRRGKGCNPVLLLVDEAAIAPIPALAHSASTVVGRRIYLWVAVQSLEQLTAEYGYSLAQAIIDNMEAEIFYRQKGLQTAKYISEKAGKISDYSHSQTIREDGEVSKGLSEQGIDLITPQVVMQMKPHDIIVFHSNLPPFKARRVDWRHHALFQKRVQIPPPILSPLPAIVPIPNLTNTIDLEDDDIDPNDII